MRHWTLVRTDISDAQRFDFGLIDRVCGSLRQRARCALIKEELIAEFWKPERLEKLLEQGGWDLVDSY